MSRLGRSRRGLAIMAVLAVLFFVGRIVWANGIFSSVPTGFLGSCPQAARLPIADIEIVNGLVFVAVSSEAGPQAGDGIYLYSGKGELTRLAGAPKDFHPRGLGSYRSPNGSGIFLLAVNRRENGRFSIDSFEVTNATTTPALVAQGTIEGGLLTGPQDVAAAGPGAFYVSNRTAKGGLAHILADWGVLPGSDILYFNGLSFRVAADDMYDARGLLLTPDGGHLLVASLTSRSLKSLSRDPFSGNLTEAGSLTLPAAPEKITLDGSGAVWAAGHADLLAWRALAAGSANLVPSQVLRIDVSGGIPFQAGQVYGNDGSEISAAGVAASLGKRLLIGSSLVPKLLECR